VAVGAEAEVAERDEEKGHGRGYGGGSGACAVGPVGGVIVGGVLLLPWKIRACERGKRLSF
jgi:hypothetical protein